MALSTPEHQRVSRETKANRNAAAKARRWGDLYAYGLIALTLDAPNMARRFPVFDGRHPGRRLPEVVSQHGREAFSCTCQQSLLLGGMDCDHISCVRRALAKYGPPVDPPVQTPGAANDAA